MHKLLSKRIQQSFRLCTVLQRRFGHTGPVKMINVAAVCRGFSHVQPEKAVSVERNTVNFDPDKSEFANKLLLKTRVASIHPADINMLEGVYGTLPEFPFVPGLEGLFEIVGCGKNVSDGRYSEGTLAAAICSATIGAWQQHVVADAKSVVPLDVSGSSLDQSLTQFQLAQLSINPCTAYRMLYDFVNLRPGDFVVQNAANSALGESVIQIAHKMGVRTINIIRRSVKGCDLRSAEEFAKIKNKLLELGADVVVGSNDLAHMNASERADLYGSDESKKPQLALNSAGGDITKQTLKLLGKNGTMVTVGNMAHDAFAASAMSLIFQNHTYKGFCLPQWQDSNPILFEEMLLELKELVMAGDFKLPTRIAKFGTNGKGFETAMRCAVGLTPLEEDFKAYMVSAEDARQASADGSDMFVEGTGKVLIHFDNEWLKAQ